MVSFLSIAASAHQSLILAHLGGILLSTPTVDQTGVNGAMLGLARIGAGFLAGVLTLFLVVQGYEYMATDEVSRGAHLKKAISALLGGAILVIAAETLAPQLVAAIVAGK